MVAVLTGIFGTDNLELAEDVVQDSLIEAIKQWTYKGVPDNPPAWLFAVAKNKALNIIYREKYKRQYSNEVLHLAQHDWETEPALNHLFSEQEILDNQLRMIFTCCHPSISADSQVALTLKTLCGFSVREIARGFLTTEENIHKRLVRARKKLRGEKIAFEVPQGSGLENRIQAVLETIYLLFNEGYSASSGVDLIRYEICEEAIRLAEIIATHAAIKDKWQVYALLALMQLNACRLKARQDKDGNILTLEQQDRSLWDLALMEKGFINLDKSAYAEQITSYHILASISAYHCATINHKPADWVSILNLYDSLIKLDNSPVVLLNRAIALAKVNGAAKAIEELEKIKNAPTLKTYHLFYSTQATLYMDTEQFPKAVSALRAAIEFAPLQAEKKLLHKQMALCLEKIT